MAMVAVRGFRCSGSADLTRLRKPGILWSRQYRWCQGLGMPENCHQSCLIECGVQLGTVPQAGRLASSEMTSCALVVPGAGVDR
jgi:hypothetical protein